MKKLLFLLLFLMNSVEAKHLGTFGHTFQIIEEDLLEAIIKKLTVLEKDGEIAKHQHNIQEKMKEKIQRPAPVDGIVKTKNPRVFAYDPSIKVPYDLKDHQGTVFVKRGTRVNPLDSYQFRQPLLFIDGDDKQQINWAIQQVKDNSKIILVKGAPFELMNTYGHVFYFDQGGKLIKKFGIMQVPARVSQESKVLKVEEIELEAEI